MLRAKQKIISIEQQKYLINEQVLRRWTDCAIECYLRSCVCENCFFNTSLKSTKCKLKAVVVMLVAKYGVPTKERLEDYFKKQKEFKMIEIENYWWFSSMAGETIGIVKTKNKITGEIKFRIGLGQGENEKQDIEYIKDWGAQFFLEKIK